MSILNVKYLRSLYQRIPDYLKNKYVITLAVFAVWMLFFDHNNLISQVKLRVELGKLRGQKAYFQEKIREVKKDQQELLTSTRSIEKFAREKYWMKKEHEDIFIIVEE